MAKKSAECKVQSGDDVLEAVESIEGPAAAGEVNWELTGSAVIDDMSDTSSLKRSLFECWEQVDPDVREDNPVWRFAYCDDHCTFIFRDGRKAVIPLRNS